MSDINALVGEILHEGWAKKIVIGAGIAAGALAAPAAVKYGAGRMAEKAYDRGDQHSVNKYQQIAMKADKYDYATPAAIAAMQKYRHLNARQMDSAQRSQSQTAGHDLQKTNSPT